MLVQLSLPSTHSNLIQSLLHLFLPASSTDAVKDPNYKPCYVAGASGLPSLDNIPSVADLTASFAARKEERLKQEAEKKEMERRVSVSEMLFSDMAGGHHSINTMLWIKTRSIS